MSDNFFETTLAHELDPEAEPGTDWAEFAAAAVFALRLSEGRGELPPVPIDPEQQSSYENPRRVWGAAESTRLEFALRLLAIVEQGDTETLSRLSDCLQVRKRDGVAPNPTMRTFESMTKRDGKFPTKRDLHAKLEKDHYGIAPRSKKGRWKAWKKHALSWLKQSR